MQSNVSHYHFLFKSLVDILCFMDWIFHMKIIYIIYHFYYLNSLLLILINV